MPFADRFDAGRSLGGRLRRYAGHTGTLVLGLARGGVPVAYEVARALDLPLDVYVVRKLGVPGHEELAMGAIATGGVRVVNHDVVAAFRIPHSVIDAVAARESAELTRRELEYRQGRPPAATRAQTAILVDDGLATGSSMQAAVAALRREGAGRVVAASPVGSREACASVGELADEAVCLEMPDDFRAVGDWYIDFSPTTGAEVRQLLERAEKERTSDYAKRK